MRYVEMRNELIQHLEALSDSEYQKKCWVNNECPNGVSYDELDYSVHFLFDDTRLAKDPKSLIGWILADEMESKCIEDLIAALNSVFEKYGCDLTDEQYISTNEWQEVISCAAVALKTIK
jgi:hypothetical protein